MPWNAPFAAILALALALSCCKRQTSEGDDHSARMFEREAHTGYNTKGEVETCYASDAACASEEPLTKAFRESCLNKSYSLYHCDCDHELCSQNPYLSPDTNLVEATKVQGYDFKGRARSCTPMAAATLCTAIQTEEDDFGAQCKQRGFVATQCGCHAWICSQSW